jgi:hypothetical protein
MAQLTYSQKKKLGQYLKEGQVKKAQVFISSLKRQRVHQTRPAQSLSSSQRVSGLESARQRLVQLRKKKFEKYYGAVSNDELERLEAIKALEQQRRIQKREAEGQKIASEERYISEKERYGKTRTGRIDTAMQRGFQVVRPGGFSRMMYGRAAIPQTIRTTQGFKSGKRGRPRGSLDRRYAAYGGVYGWRKHQAAQLRMQKMQMQRQTSVTPQQEQQLRYIQQRQMAVRQDPERQIFPDTTGNVDLNSIFRDIDSAAGMVP